MIRTRQVRFTIATGLTLAAMLSGALIAPVSAKEVAAPAGYSYTSYAYPHDTFTQLLAINNGGKIAGYHGAKINKGLELRLPKSVQNENFPGSAQTQVIGINNHGDTVGFYVDTKNVTHGFYFNHGANKWSPIDVPGTKFNQLLGVDDSGNSAGYYQFGKNSIFQPYTRTPGGAFRLPPIPNAQMTDVNNTGDVTGFEVLSGTSDRAFVVLGSSVRYFQYPGATFTQALGLNNQHLVVGTYNDKAGNAHGFTYNVQTSAFRPINVPGSTSTVVNGLNDHGWLVGFYTAPNKDTIGFVAKPK